MKNTEEEILALLIVNKKSFANAYQLCKILAWKFKLINCDEIIKRIKQKNYVECSFPISKTLTYFQITDGGKIILSENYLSLIETLKIEYPEEIKFVSKLGKL